MNNKLAIKILFYGLIVTSGFAVGLLYMKSVTPKTPTVAYSNTVTNSPETTVKNTNINTPRTNPKTQPVKNTNAPVNKPITNTPPTPSAPTCIITIDGQRYDVQPLRNTHSGGDVFQCNTDMSDIFHGQHGDNLRMIQKFQIQ